MDARASFQSSWLPGGGCHRKTEEQEENVTPAPILPLVPLLHLGGLTCEHLQHLHISIVWCVKAEDTNDIGKHYAKSTSLGTDTHRPQVLFTILSAVTKYLRQTA